MRLIQRYRRLAYRCDYQRRYIQLRAERRIRRLIRTIRHTLAGA